MAQKIVTLCDAHLADGGLEVPARGWSVTLQPPGGKPMPYTVDVCEEHAKPLAELSGYLAELGRPKSVPAPIRGSVSDEPLERRTCKVCGFVSNARTSLGTHVRHKHDMTLRESEGLPRRAVSTKEAS